MWTEVRDQETFARAWTLARGEYQRDILRGIHNLSGSSLSSTQRLCYGSRYARSRNALLQRLTESGIPWTERRGAHNRRILVIG